MAKKRFIFQGITKNNHLDELKWLLSIPNPKEIILSTAFMREGGINLIEDEISGLAKKPRIFSGIRNGITTAQALEKSLSIGCETYAVDTGSSVLIFHPKIYLSSNEEEARLIVGSANLTVGGLNGNIEASVCITLNLSDKADVSLLEEIKKEFTDMIAEHPENIFKVNDGNQIATLLSAGRLADERVKIAVTPVGKSTNRELDTISRIKLKTQKIARRVAVRTTTATQAASVIAVTPVAGDVRTLLWEGSPLTRRDLTIPENENSNQTGSTLLKKGNSEIDQQTYFRNEVFNELTWTADDRTAGKELAEADFQLIVKSVDYGIHRLVLSHDTRTDTPTYRQRQPMTSLRWGAARDIVAKEDLLERTMSLYKSDVVKGLFIIEIE